MASAPLPSPRRDHPPSVPALRAMRDPLPAMAPPREPARLPEPRRRAVFGWPAPALIVLILVAVLAGSMELGLVACCCLVAVGLIFAAQGLRRLGSLARRDPPASLREWATAVALAVAGPALALFGAILVLLSTMAFARGRQLRRRGRVRLPPVEEGGAWAREDLHPCAPDDVRRALAEQWRENGRTEHASVAAFSRLVLDLVALGAPPRLIEAAHRDALDEIRHAELCFGLARALDGEERGPGPFAEARRARGLSRSRTLALSQLAVDSLVDGALNEGVSARVLAQLARRCEDEATRAVLREIVADEGRHSAHGWHVVEWCLAEGGAPVAHALRGALAALPARLRTSLPEGARDGSWERHGIPGAGLEAEHLARGRELIRRRVGAMIERALAA